MTDWIKIEGFPNYSINKYGVVRNDRRGRCLKHTKREGYAAVNLSDKGRARKFNVHNLVAKLFVPNPHNLPIINHLDEDRFNPRWDNLEWTTYQGNFVHFFISMLCTNHTRGK